MVLSSSKRTSSIASISNQFQGGGNNKPGLYPQVGRSSWTSVGYGANGIPRGFCCKRSILTRLNFKRITPSVGNTVAPHKFSPF
jgi:hypothetical protein